MKVLLGRRRGSCRAWEREEIVEVGRLGEGGQRKWGEMGLKSM